MSAQNGAAVSGISDIQPACMHQQHDCCAAWPGAFPGSRPAHPPHSLHPLLILHAQQPTRQYPCSTLPRLPTICCNIFLSCLSAATILPSALVCLPNLMCTLLNDLCCLCSFGTDPAYCGFCASAHNMHAGKFGQRRLLLTVLVMESSTCSTATVGDPHSLGQSARRQKQPSQWMPDQEDYQGLKGNHKQRR